MKTTVEKVSNLSRKLNVEIPAAQVKATFNKVFLGLQKEVAIKGFRKGKAPINTIKSIYADQVKHDVAQELVQQHYPKALAEHQLTPISYPDIEFSHPAEATDFTFTASFEIRPEINLKKYEGLEVEKEKMEFDEAKINSVLDNIRSSRATLENILEVRSAQNGDTAVIDFEGFIDGQPLENGNGTDHNLELGSKQFIEGFEEGIIGMNINDNRTLKLQFPTPYQAAELAGKPVEFKVTLKALKKKVLPELTNEFLTSIGAPGDVESLKKTIREDMEQSETKRIEDAFKNRLLKALVKENPVEVPASLMKEQKEALIKDFKKRMTDQGMNEAEYLQYVEKWDKEFESTASEMIQANFLVDEIASKHNLFCTDVDLDNKFIEYAKQTGLEESRIREFYGKPEQTSRLSYQITEDKVVRFLTQSAKIKEVNKNQLKEEAN